MPDVDALTADEVAAMLRVSRNTVYNLVKREELASYHVGRKMRFARADVENYIARSAASARPVARPAGVDAEVAAAVCGDAPRADGPSPSSGVDVPAADRGAASGARVQVGPGLFDETPARPVPYAIAGNDILGDMLTNYLGAISPGLGLERIYEGSYAALVDVFRGRAQAALVHLYDRVAYNVPFVERMLPGMRVRMVRLVGRRQGLVVAKGNPKHLRTWQDLGRPDVRIANRERGCGSRVLLDAKLAECGIDRTVVAGYDREHPSALTAASLVARGAADACIGSERVFHQVDGVDFLPLQDEWLDIALSLETPAQRRIADALRSIVRTKPFREEAGRIVGYDVSRMGEVVFER